MKHLLTIALLTLAPTLRAQDAPKPADLAFTVKETARLAELSETDQTLALMRSSVAADLAEADKVIAAPVWNERLAAFAAKRRRSGLLTLHLIEKQAAQLKTDIEKWQADVRERAQCPDCEFDWQNRRLVKPAQPKGK